MPECLAPSRATCTGRHPLRPQPGGLLTLPGGSEVSAAGFSPDKLAGVSTPRCCWSVRFPGEPASGQASDHVTPASEMETFLHVGQHTGDGWQAVSPGSGSASSFSLVTENVAQRRPGKGQSTAVWLLPPERWRKVRANRRGVHCPPRVPGSVSPARFHVVLTAAVGGGQHSVLITLCILNIYF